MSTKVCAKCEIEWPIEEFTLIKATGSRKARCKKCEAARVKAYYHENEEYRERVKATARLRDDPVAWAEHMRQKDEAKANQVEPETRICNRCQRELPFSEFNKHPNAQFGRNRVCRECKITEGRDAAKTGRWKSFTPEAQRSYKLMKLYGMTAEEYDTRLKGQGGGCALCGSTESGSKAAVKFLMVDHNHETGAVRGLLCATCNMWVGNYEQLLERAGEGRLMRYLHPERYEPIDLSRVQVNAGIVHIS